MINFIVCDSNKVVVAEVKRLIEQKMMKNDICYQIHTFYKYDDEFNSIINKPMSNKIYILDIETSNISGIDVAKTIRNNDYQSVIIFLASDDKYGQFLLQKEFPFLSFINKTNDLDSKLFKSLQICMKKFNLSKMLNYSINGSFYNIPVDDIIYVSRDQVERKCFIKTSYLEAMISKPLSEIKEILGDEFIYSHRSCLINQSKVRVVDTNAHKIYFSDNLVIDLFSQIYRKELKKYCEIKVK